MIFGLSNGISEKSFNFKIFSHGDFSAWGVLVAFRENLDYQIEDKVIDEAGRYIVLKCRIQDSPFLLVNLYNPNNKNEQVKTKEKVKQGIDHLNPIMIIILSLEVTSILFKTQSMMQTVIPHA